jgi:hypothetical protein
MKSLVPALVPLLENGSCPAPKVDAAPAATPVPASGDVLQSVQVRADVQQHAAR